MRIRTGFVSNSSSSSFCLVIKKVDYDAEFTKLKEDKAALLHGKPKCKVFDGVELCMVSGYMDNEQARFNDVHSDDLDIDELNVYTDAIENFVKKLRKHNHFYDEIEG